MKTVVLSAALLSTVLLPACSSSEMYGAGQGWQRSECNRMLEPDRSACLARTKDDYDTYEKKRKGTY